MEPVTIGLIAGGSIGGILGGFGAKMKADSQVRELNAAEAMARRNARNARMGFYAQSNGFRMMSDLEQTRLARSHAQKIGNMESKIGGSGAMAGEGTTWDVVVAQDAENQAEMKDCVEIAKRPQLQACHSAAICHSGRLCALLQIECC